MRKSKLFALSLTVLSIFILTGCDDDDNKDANYRKLESRVAQLEQDIATLKNTGTDNSTSSLDAESTDNSADSSNTISNEAASDTIESLTSAVEEVTAKADSATPSGNKDESRTQFFNLKDELDLVERRLDTYYDYIEAQYKQGNLSYEDYRNQEQALEDIENKLDASEDRLERTFGIND